MRTVSILLFVFSANLDCLPVAIMYGTNKIKISYRYSIIISFICALGTYLSMLLGYALTSWLPLHIANNIGSFLLLSLGIYFLYMALKKEITYDSTTMTIQNMLFLSFTLTINNMALAIGASITGIPIFTTTIFSFIICNIFILLGQFIGRILTLTKFKRYPAILSSILLLILGIYELFI